MLREAVAAEEIIEKNALETVNTKAEQALQKAMKEAGEALDKVIASGGKE